MTKTEIKIGSVVKHAYRKTLTFVVTETTRTGRFHVQRAKKINGVWVPQNQYKGYALSNSDFVSGRVTIVDGKSSLTETKVAAKGKSSPDHATMVMSIPELESLARIGGVEQFIVDGFKTLESRMSPENLTCDGEAGPAYIKREMNEVNRIWALLESIVKHPVERSF